MICALIKTRKKLKNTKRNEETKKELKKLDSVYALESYQRIEIICTFNNSEKDDLQQPRYIAYQVE